MLFTAAGEDGVGCRMLRKRAIHTIVLVWILWELCLSLVRCLTFSSFLPSRLNVQADGHGWLVGMNLNSTNSQLKSVSASQKIDVNHQGTAGSHRLWDPRTSALTSAMIRSNSSCNWFIVPVPCSGARPQRSPTLWPAHVRAGLSLGQMELDLIWWRRGPEIALVIPWSLPWSMLEDEKRVLVAIDVGERAARSQRPLEQEPLTGTWTMKNHQGPARTSYAKVFSCKSRQGT
jgi:hypothetical protein